MVGGRTWERETGRDIDPGVWGKRLQDCQAYIMGRRDDQVGLTFNATSEDAVRREQSDDLDIALLIQAAHRRSENACLFITEQTIFRSVWVDSGERKTRPLYAPPVSKRRSGDRRTSLDKLLRQQVGHLSQRYVDGEECDPKWATDRRTFRAHDHRHIGYTRTLTQEFRVPRIRVAGRCYGVLRNRSRDQAVYRAVQRQCDAPFYRLDRRPSGRCRIIPRPSADEFEADVRVGIETAGAGRPGPDDDVFDRAVVVESGPRLLHAPQGPADDFRPYSAGIPEGDSDPETGERSHPGRRVRV